jgi:hypothetical protein
MRNRNTLLFCTALIASACASEPDDDLLATEIHALATAQACPPVEKVAPGVLSTDRDEGRLVFTPDGDTAYFHVANADGTLSIMESRNVDGTWTTPVVASFSGHNDFDAFVTPDGDELWFSSWRGVDGGRRARTRTCGR